jgi:hypothetical protein
MSELKAGDTIRAIKPFRVGIGRGPNRDGLCAVGDEFEVLDARPDDLMIRHKNYGATFTLASDEGRYWERLPANCEQPDPLNAETPGSADRDEVSQ